MAANEFIPATWVHPEGSSQSVAGVNEAQRRIKESAEKIEVAMKELPAFSGKEAVESKDIDGILLSLAFFAQSNEFHPILRTIFKPFQAIDAASPIFFSILFSQDSEVRRL